VFLFLQGFIVSLAILNFIALVIVNVQAYKARNIHDELSESKYIGIATLSMLQIFIVGVPLLVIVYHDPNAYFFVMCGIIFIICTTILFLIFVPKIIRWKNPPKRRDGQATYDNGIYSTTNMPLNDQVVRTVSDVEKGDKSTQPNASGNGRVSFIKKCEPDNHSDSLHQHDLVVSE
jgi:hypothetical protein